MIATDIQKRQLDAHSVRFCANAMNCGHLLGFTKYQFSKALTIGMIN